MFVSHFPKLEFSPPRTERVKRIYVAHHAARADLRVRIYDIDSDFPAAVTGITRGSDVRRPSSDFVSLLNAGLLRE
jgi:hypothetical protein